MAITTTLIDMYSFNHILLVAGFSTAVLLGFAWVSITNQEKCRNIGKFIWSCFMKPIPGSDTGWGGHLESFYAGQADVYDATRKGLLKGRTTMMKLAAAHLRSGIAPHEKGNLVWVDIGGGTGWNIEKMNEIFPLREYFKRIYLVDLSPSLCNIARERIRRLHLADLVYVLCDDAVTFELPGMPDADGNVDLITMSYSLSMMPSYFAVIDKVDKLLSKDGVYGVADFYVAGQHSFADHVDRDYGVQSRHVNWLSRQFWRIWFEFDRVFLDPARRDYLEYRFGTIKSLNGRNGFIVPFIIRIPYYVWLGCKKDRDPNAHKRLDAIATESPYLKPTMGTEEKEIQIHSKAYDQAVINLEANLPLPSFLYQKRFWRIPYDPKLKKHAQFTNYIYAFTWEDPREDQKLLNITKNDVMLVISSAGDNALSYAISSQPSRIHCVDLNPCQNHLLELKLAALVSLSHQDIWQLFGLGRHPNFRKLLHENLSPHLSSHALQFWVQNGDHFNLDGKGLYETGYSGWALKLTRWLFAAMGVTEDVKKMCNARTIKEQVEIYEKKVRPALLHPWIVSILMANPVFLWKALGVPMNQMNMYLTECTTVEYVAATFDPIIHRSLLRNDNYFYYLCLTGHYTPECSPDYLKPPVINALKSSRALESFRLHTDTVEQVLGRLTPNTLTKAILMDHMDWMDWDGIEVRKEIVALKMAMKAGGQVMFRSAAKKPWYVKIYEEEGFQCSPVAVRDGNSIDRINMYASTWIAKLSGPPEMEALKLPEASLDM